MIATLPMYARPELVDVHARYYSLIRDELSAAGIDCPAELTLGGDEYTAWRSADLVFSQTCGLPYRRDLHGEVTLIGTPDYRLDGCEPGYGRSGFVVRRDDGRGSLASFAETTFAYNQDHSESGLASPQRRAAGLGFTFQHVLQTGSHIESARAVAAGEADIAAIDAVTWRSIERFEDYAPSLHVIDWTEPVGWLPYITSLDGPAQVMFDAISQAIERLDAADRDALSIYGLVQLPLEAYLDPS